MSAPMLSRRVFSSGINEDFQPVRKVDLTEDEAKAAIEQDITNNDVFLFMKGHPDAPQCGFSRQVCLILQHLGVSFESRNVLADNSIREGIKTYSNWPTIPQLYVKGELVGGCDIVTDMFKSNELQVSSSLPALYCYVFIILLSFRLFSTVAYSFSFTSYFYFVL